MIKANYHTHTRYCDGKDTPEDVIRHALSLGMTHLGFSGHMDPDIHMDLDAYYDELRKLRQKYAGQIDILIGVELDNLYDPACARDAEYVIGSTHFLDVDMAEPFSVDSAPEKIDLICSECFGGDYYRMSRAYYEFESRVYDRLHCTFVGHFDLITRFNDEMHFVDETDPAYLRPALEAMEYLVSEGVPFEINCGAVNRGRKKELYPRPELLKALHDFGGEILINSDAHQKELLMGAFDRAAAAAVSAGFTHINYLEHDTEGRVVFRQHPLDLPLRA